MCQKKFCGGIRRITDVMVLIVLCLIVSILDIAVGSSHYKKYRQFSSLVLCSLGCGLLAFACMVATIAVFLT